MLEPLTSKLDEKPIYTASCYVSRYRGSFFARKANLVMTNLYLQLLNDAGEELHRVLYSEIYYAEDRRTNYAPVAVNTPLLMDAILLKTNNGKRIVLSKFGPPLKLLVIVPLCLFPPALVLFILYSLITKKDGRRWGPESTLSAPKVKEIILTANPTVKGSDRFLPTRP